MEPSGVPSRHLHHKGRRSKHHTRHRRHTVAHNTQAHGSDHGEPLAVWPTRDEYAHDGDKHALVNTWLEDIETPHLQPLRKNESPFKESGPRTRSRPESTHRPRSPSPSKLFSDNGHNGQVFEVSPRQKLRERKRPRDLVQRNSVLDLSNEQDPVRGQPGRRLALVATESTHDSSKDKSLVGSKGSVVSVISATEDRFAKKARHKTKTDRYETKDRKPRKRGKKKRKNPGDQGRTNETKRRGEFSSAREVMENFNSKSILSDRITVQPTVRPGLFENGRASKDQLPDLTFHEMHFLKGPLPSKPTPHDHERAKRRGERELEEVSAFFLHKGMPEASGASGRDHHHVSGASSLDRARRGSSAFSTDAPPHQIGPGEEYGHRSPEVDGESSRATDWTWSSSYAALERGPSQATGSREHVPAQKPTPSPSRNAIRRTREMDNTGADCVEAIPRSKGIWSPRAPLAVLSSDIVNRQLDMSTKNIRIVRYHDRGVMASEEAESTAGCRQKGKGARSDAVEQPRAESPAESPSAVNVVKSSQFGPEAGRIILAHGEGQVCEVAGSHAADHDSEPARPRSPKCTMIEQLEAAVENTESQELQSDLARRLYSLPAQQDGQAASAQYSNNVQGAHSPYQDGYFEIKPRFDGGRQHDQFEATQKNESFYTVNWEPRDSQQAHEVNLAPQMASRQGSVNSHRLSNVDQPYLGVRSAHRGPFGAHLMARHTLGNPSSVQMISPHRDLGSPTVMNDWAATGPGQLPSDSFFHQTQSVFPEAAEIPSRRPDRQHSLEEYIAQMENEVFCRPHDAADDDSPIPSWHSMQDSHGFYRDFGPQERQLDVDAYDQDLSEGGHLKDGSAGGVHYGGGSAMHDSEVDHEEQRFMSTFWRPNCH